MDIKSVDVSHLTEFERLKLLNVLERDQQLRNTDEERIRQLKRELAHLRRRGALREGINADRCCARCLEELGRFVNRGALCPLCRRKVCKYCRLYPTDEEEKPFLGEHLWICIFCHKQMQLKKLSNKWVYQFNQTPPTDQLKKALRETPRRSLTCRIEPESKEMSLDPRIIGPPKPPRTFTYRSSKCQSVSDISHSDLCQDVNIFRSEDSVHAAVQNTDSKEDEDEKCQSVSPVQSCSARPMPRVSPWSGIDAEPSIPVRSPKAATFSHLMSAEWSQVPTGFRSVEHWAHKDRLSSDDGHSTTSFRSHSTSSEIVEDSESFSTISRRKMSPLRKQHAIPEPFTPCQQNSSSIDTTDSGVFSPGIKTDDVSIDRKSPLSPLTSMKSDGESHSVSELRDASRTEQCHLSSSHISSSSESNGESSSPQVTKKVVFKKRRQSKKESWKTTLRRSDCSASADESGNSLRSSPHGRLRNRHRTLSGGSEDGRMRKEFIPQISVSEFSQAVPGVAASATEKDSSTQEEDVDQAFTYHSRSQMSLSSFGGRSESVTSVYSAAGGGRYGTVNVTGEVLFSQKYNYKLGVFEVLIKECRNLAPVDTKRNRSDPYVKVYLLPDRTKSGKRKTKVKKHTLNPVFDEMLKFQVTISELERRTLWLSVWHSDRFGRNDFLGEVMLPLGHDTFENTELKWYPLQERLESLDTPVSYKGDIILALKYVPPDVTSRKPNKKPGDPAKGSLHVLVKEARNLMATRSNGTSDPFCKSYLLPDKSKSGKQKTSVLKKTCSPKWNHTFVYDDVTLDELRERCLELTIWDYDKITSNDFLGGVRLCLGSGKHQGRDVEWMDSAGEEVSLWYTMLDRPNMWVDGSLLLRPSMQNRKIST